MGTKTSTSLSEVGLLDLRRLPPGQDTVPFTVAPGDDGGGYVGFDQYDVVTQQFTSNHVTVSADGSGHFRRAPFRYVWPAEMELMARIAGLQLKYRWSDWDRSDFTQDSTKHISVWMKPGVTPAGLSATDRPGNDSNATPSFPANLTTGD